VWRTPPVDASQDGSRDAFRRLQTLERFLTTGCNIPVFVAGHDIIEPIDRNKLGRGFRWINQFDADDALGWPLRELSRGYEALVEDVRVNASGGALFSWLKSASPYSHTQYWRTGAVLDRIARELQSLIAH
jgi:hypothetical protein